MEDFYNNRYTQKLTGGLERLRAFHDADNISFIIDLVRWGVFRNTASVLDLGGGWAIHSDLISKNLDKVRVTKTDFSLVAMKYLSKKLGKYYDPNVLKTICNCECLPFRDCSFDVIIFSQVLEHVQNDDFALNECHRLLKENGLIVLAVPNCYNDMYKLFHPLERIFDESGHIHEYCEETVKNKLSKAGFIIQKQRYHCFFLFWIFAWIERTKFSFKLQKFLSNHQFVEEFFRLAITIVLLLENMVLGHISRGGFSIQFVAVKR